MHHDEQCLVMHKPANMLSVPGRQMLDTMREQNNASGAHSRVLQWTAVIQAVREDLQQQQELLQPQHGAALQVLQKVKVLENVPRKEKLLLQYMKRTMKVTDPDLQACIWSLLHAQDVSMWQPKLEDIPPPLVSAYDVARYAAGGGSVFAVHRLDMETSGVLLFAKTSEASAHLSAQFAGRETKKRYLAEVSGVVSPALQKISHKIRPDLTRRPWQMVDEEHGKECETHVAILEHRTTPWAPRGNSTLVQLNPITGRTHQLRVHMAHEGHATIGDSLYASAEIYAQSEYLRLHAQSLQFRHPHSEESVTVVSDDCLFA